MTCNGEPANYGLSDSYKLKNKITLYSIGKESRMLDKKDKTPGPGY